MNLFTNLRDISLRNWLLITLMFLMTIFQQNFKLLKILVMLVLILYTAYDFLTKKSNISKHVLTCYIFWILLFFIYFIYSYLRGNPGALASLKVEVIYPFIMFLITFNFKDKLQIDLITKSFIYINIITILIIFFCLISKLFNIVIFNDFCNFFGFAYGLHDGYIETSLYNLDALFFSIPFTFYNYIVNKKRNVIYSLSTVLSILYLLVCGRAALQILICLSFLICIIISKFNYIKSLNIYKILKICLIILLFIIVFITFSGIGKMIFNEIINLFSNTNVRYQQFVCLFNDFLAHPVFGNGLGFVSKIIRDSSMPWAYELTYVKLLASLGVVGFSIYLYLLYCIVVKPAIINKIIFPYSLGTIMMLIANFSNPYLTRFDNIWIIFIPVIIYNIIAKDKVFSDYITK